MPHESLFEVLWGEPVVFGDSEQKMYMIYYGLLICSTFIGVGLISSRPPSPKENLIVKMA